MGVKLLYTPTIHCDLLNQYVFWLEQLGSSNIDITVPNLSNGWFNSINRSELLVIPSVVSVNWTNGISLNKSTVDPCAQMIFDNISRITVPVVMFGLSADILWKYLKGNVKYIPRIKSKRSNLIIEDDSGNIDYCPAFIDTNTQYLQKSMCNPGIYGIRTNKTYQQFEKWSQTKYKTMPTVDNAFVVAFGYKNFYGIRTSPVDCVYSADNPIYKKHGFPIGDLISNIILTKILNPDDEKDNQHSSGDNFAGVPVK